MSPDDKKFVVLSFGGSLGAPKINETAISVMKDFAKDREDVMCIHSGGRNYYQEARKAFSEAGLEKDPRFVLKDYIYNMSDYMTAADLIICRAGAMTLTELAMLRKAAILIPSPNVTDNHQYKNAKALYDKGAAMLIEEKDLCSQSICEAVEKMYSDIEYRESVSRAIEQFASDDTNEKIYAQISRLIRNRAKIQKKGN